MKPTIIIPFVCAAVAVSCGNRSTKLFSDFANKITNSISPNELLHWSDTIFKDKSNKVGPLPTQKWPSFIITNKPVQPNFIMLAYENGTNLCLILEYLGSFGGMGISISEKDKPSTADFNYYDEERGIKWTNRVSLYYSP